MIKRGDICAILALAMQCAPSVHPDTVLDIARVESGFNPYVIAEMIPKSERYPDKPSVISHHPKTKDDAIRLVNQIEQKKRRYLVGFMQITSINFNHYRSLPVICWLRILILLFLKRLSRIVISVAVRLKGHRVAIISGNFSTGQQPEAAFSQTNYVQRIGYALPSTRQYKVNKENAPIFMNKRLLQPGMFCVSFLV